jgi:phosphate transport system permease protein
MRRTSSRGSLPRLVALSLALVPVIFFLLMTLNLLWTSLPALREVGMRVLFSTKFSNVFSGTYNPGEYGLLPAIWGTVLVATLALLFAAPVSLSLAILASEYSMGGVGRILELILAVFSGIPPIIYGLLSYFLVTAWMRPKFGADGVPEEWIRSLPGLPAYNAGMLPREISTLLGAIFVALLIIPFMSPLMLDAIRNVPQGLKEASLGMGATRWYTLWRIILPAALSGVIAALSLGVLKAIGDVVIVAWTIGYYKSGLPVPLIDFFEASAPLTSTGAGLLTGLSPGADINGGMDFSVAYFAGFFLLLMAFGVLGLADRLQKTLQRRLQQ